MTAMRVAGNEAGNGDFGKRDGDCDKGGGQAMAMATKRVTVMVSRVAGWW